MVVKLDGPIPGQSLTSAPGNSPWEQPAKYADPEKALAWHLSKFEDSEVLDDTMYLLKQGFPLSVFVESLMTMGVMEGYHTIDVSMIIAPIVHEYLYQFALSLNIKVVENQDPTPDERKKARDKERLLIQLESMFDSDPTEAVEEAVEDGGQAMEEPVPQFKSGGFIRRR